MEKQIPELEIVSLLKNAKGERTQKIDTEKEETYSAGTLDKVCSCESPSIGKSSGKCLRCGGKSQEEKSS